MVKLTERIAKKEGVKKALLTTWPCILNGNKEREETISRIYGTPFFFWERCKYKPVNSAKDIELIRQIHESMGIRGRRYQPQKIYAPSIGRVPIIGFYENGWPMVLMKKYLSE